MSLPQRRKQWLLACLLLLLVAVLSQRGAAQAPATQTLSFPSAADCYVDAATPAANFDVSPVLKADWRPLRIVYLRFTVSGVGHRPVQQARLRLGVSTAAASAMSATGGSLHRVADNSWDESTITFGSRPAVDGAAIATLGPVGLGATAEFDLAGAVTGDGVYSFAIDTSNNDGVAYVSAAAATGQKPELVLTVPAGSEPTVGIAQPSDGATFFVGDPVTLQASASDVVDGDLVIASSAVKDIDNPSSTKQNATPASGIEVIASSRGDMSYWHNGVQP